MKKIIFVSILLLSTVLAFGQEQKKDKLLSTSLGTGVLTFNGDVGKGKQVSAYTYIRSGHVLNIEKRLKDEWIGVSFNYMNGKLAMGERSVLVNRNNNFESKINQFGLQISGYLQNKKEIPVIPYATAGIAFATLKTYADLLYDGNKSYYYWNDGSIRDLPQSPGNEFNAKFVNRDYIYETKIDSADKSLIALPLGGGIKLNLTPRFETKIGLQYHITFNDGIDAMKTQGNDKYLYSYFTLTYSIFQWPKTIKSQASFDFDYAEFEKADEDGDGVTDLDDECPGTESGAKVDAKGCAEDADKDGIPDHRDKEPNTPSGALVDADGKTLTNDAIQQQSRKDSAMAAKAAFYKTVTSTTALEKFDEEIKNKISSQPASTSKVPAKFAVADKNKDGIISSSEITGVIDGFFDGTNDFTVEKIHELIEYFFDQ